MVQRALARTADTEMYESDALFATAVRRRRPCLDHCQRRRRALLHHHHHPSPMYSKWTSSRACKAAATNVSRAQHERARQVSPRARRTAMLLQAERWSRARAELVQSARGARCLREFEARAPRRRTTPRPMTKRRARRSPPAARTGSGPIGRLPRERTPGVLQKPARPPETRQSRVQSDRTIPSAASERRMTQPRARDPRSSSYPAAGRDGLSALALVALSVSRVLRDSAPTPGELGAGSAPLRRALAARRRSTAASRESSGLSSATRATCAKGAALTPITRRARDACSSAASPVLEIGPGECLRVRFGARARSILCRRERVNSGPRCVGALRRDCNLFEQPDRDLSARST